jgi:hypothetical protein
MRKYFWLFVVLLLPTPAEAQTEKDAVLATVQQFFDGMASRDTVALKAVLTEGGQFTVVVPRGDSTMVQVVSYARFISDMGSVKQALLERIWNSRVMIDGPLAAVWTPYDFHVDGKLSHCGTDLFTLVRERGGWKISGASYTVTQNCKPSPLDVP